MKKYLKGLSLVLAAGMVVGVMPSVADADSNQKDKSFQVTAGVTTHSFSILKDAADAVALQVEEAAEEVEPEVSVEELAVGDAVEQMTEEDWSNRLMATVEENLNVRTEPSTEAALAGKLRKGDVADILEGIDGWYKIKSGNLVGFVSSEFCVVGDEAKAYAHDICTLYAKPVESGLRVRTEPSTESGILDVVAEEDKIKVNKDAQMQEEWVEVVFDGESGFVHKDFVNLELNLTSGITVEEEAALIAAQKEQEAKAAGKTKGKGVAAGGDDVTLLGAIIQCEAGVGNYDALLAVGAVVCNRAKRGYGGGSIRGVIYQPGQFPPATSGKMASLLNGGVNGRCLQAAREALSGVDNTGGAVNFRPASSGAGGRVIGGNVFF